MSYFERNGGIGMQGGMVVKQVGDEGQVELVDAVDDVLGRQETAASELIRLLKHHLGAAQQIVLLCCCEVQKVRKPRQQKNDNNSWSQRGYPQGFHRDAGIERCDLLEQVGVHLRVGNVGVEIGATSVGARLFQLVVNPTEKDSFGRKLHQFLNAFVVAE